MDHKNRNPMRAQSQKAMILADLQAGKVITPIMALAQYGTTKLATRISELINDDGHTEIVKEWVEYTNHRGTTKVMSYRIKTA